LPENRERLKALRQAELRAWDSAGVGRRYSADPASARLPICERHRADGRLKALLFLFCSLTLVFEFGGRLWHSAPGWHAFVDYVRLLIG
jgi:hypothetical protein